MRPLVLIPVALVTGLAAFFLTRWLATPDLPPDEMTWLRQEFALTPAQAGAIEKLHASYRPVCDEHCLQIMTARRRLDELARDAAGTPAHTEAVAAMERLVQICDESTRRHLEAVAAQMAPAQGRRYLELIGPQLARHGHEQPFGLK